MTYEWIISNAFVGSLQSLSRVKRLISPIFRVSVGSFEVSPR